MSDKKQSQDEPGKKKSIFGSLFTREKPDREYVPDLKKQWSDMDSPRRVQFILGVVIGLIIFIGSLVLAYFLLSKFIG